MEKPTINGGLCFRFCGQWTMKLFSTPRLQELSGGLKMLWLAHIPNRHHPENVSDGQTDRFGLGVV
ncbi:MAG: hypothetical protein K1Y36_10375 [Blastocatellia bacterium]|nr:hypothetical protein [Blastocatellia bacterium]